MAVIAKVENTIVHVLVGCNDLDYLGKSAATVITKTYKLFGEKRNQKKKRTGNGWAQSAKCSMPGI